MAQQEAAQSDIVKKGMLKYRASKVKRTSGSSAQGPKSAKLLFIVFRALRSGDKVLHMYTSDRKYHEAENPKWKVYLNDAASVCFLMDRKSFCVTMGDGGLLFLDAGDLEDAEEWVRCLNAVLYAKGIGGESTLQYEVELEPTSRVGYYGAAVLELRDHDLIVWKGETWDELFRWKLNHLRSFKAKKHKLTIVAGTRSSTGQGEFVFKSRHSIQITHAIETVVAKVKYRSSPRGSPRGSPAPPSSRPSPPSERSYPPPSTTLQRAVPDTRDPLLLSLASAGGAVGATVIPHVPDFRPPEVYDVIPDNPTSPQEEYGKLEHSNMRPRNLMLGAENGHHRNMQPVSPNSSPPHRGDILSPGREAKEYGKLERTTKPKPAHHIRATPIKPSRPGYEDIDLDCPVQEGYGRLERNGSDSPPPLPVPRENRETSKSPRQSKRLLPPKKPLPYTQRSPSPSPHDEVQEEYGHLGRSHAPAANNGHAHPNHTHPAEDTYEAVDDGVQLQVVHPEAYTKLSHTHFTSATEQDEYSRLGTKPAKKLSVPCKDEVRSKMKLKHAMHSLPAMDSEQESYGKLDRGISKQDPKVNSRSKPKPAPRQSSLQSPPGDGYGRLERNGAAGPRHGFDPYGSLPVDAERISITSNTSQDSTTSHKSGLGDTSEETSTPLYSTIDKKGDTVNNAATNATGMPVYSSLKKPTPKRKPDTPKAAPPPGYENSDPLSATAASQAAAVTTNGVPPTVPPRASERNNLRYQNIGPDGMVLVDKQPLSDEGFVDNEIYTESKRALDNDYIEDSTVDFEVETTQVKITNTPVAMATEATTEAGTQQTANARPLPAPKPKPKPKPKQRS